MQIGLRLIGMAVAITLSTVGSVALQEGSKRRAELIPGASLKESGAQRARFQFLRSFAPGLRRLFRMIGLWRTVLRRVSEIKEDP